MSLSSSDIAILGMELRYTFQGNFQSLASTVYSVTARNVWPQGGKSMQQASPVRKATFCCKNFNLVLYSVLDLDQAQNTAGEPLSMVMKSVHTVNTI